MPQSQGMEQNKRKKEQRSDTLQKKRRLIGWKTGPSLFPYERMDDLYKSIGCSTWHDQTQSDPKGEVTLCRMDSNQQSMEYLTICATLLAEDHNIEEKPENQSELYGAEEVHQFTDRNNSISPELLIAIEIDIRAAI